jgi:hypothetical protein
VLLFTEYLATQSALLEALVARHGPGAVAFINGPGAVEGWTAGGTQTVRAWRLDRETAADSFNSGRVRFLVSTEAGGEGIDLQENCHSLIHVDLPWNPMRLHQRVGRLNRYGQRHPVEVFALHNPETIEGRVWEQLEHKLRTISQQLAPGMDDPEDLLQLVLGMTDPGLFNELYAGAAGRTDGPDNWVAGQLAELGGVDARAAAIQLVGSAARFDPATSAADLPRLDLIDLRPFLFRALRRHRIEPNTTAEHVSFTTPEAWRPTGARAHYDGMTFDRNFRGKNAAQCVLGVGHKGVDAAVKEARELTASASVIPADALPGPLAVFRIVDELTGTGTVTRATICAAVAAPTGVQVFRDWELLLALNRLPDALDPGRVAAPGDPVAVVEVLRAAIAKHLATWKLPYTRPRTELLGTLWPAAQTGR